jgi:hypothetical protein
MGKYGALFLQRRQTKRFVDHEGARTAYVRHEIAWADAWPHLDTWFKTEVLLRQHGMNSPITI